MSNLTKLPTLNTFVIYDTAGTVLGFVEHFDGERACNKAEYELRQDVLIWNTWENATPAERTEAKRLGNIT
jgi:hypothetical protein